MARRVGRKPCKHSGKIVYRDEAAAIQGAVKIARIQLDGRRQVTTLYGYQCPDLTHWHLTHEANHYGRPNRTMTPEEYRT